MRGKIGRILDLYREESVRGQGGSGACNHHTPAALGASIGTRDRVGCNGIRGQMVGGDTNVVLLADMGHLARHVHEVDG